MDSVCNNRSLALLFSEHNTLTSSALLLPYLEVSVNQEYLVNRIGELASGSCVGELSI